ncbi:MAG: carboxypeptidase-like regulatory domain-containing protein, partial [Tannerella sp.]|nr:carboxypeptidase-like regulatory domain-containing protein [Tannerella sp.]
MYNDIDLTPKVSIDVKQTSLEAILRSVLTPKNLTYEVKNKQILIKNSKLDVSQTAQQAKKITGTVTDETGEPVIGANVVEKGTTNGLITDVDGNFTLNVSLGATIVVSYIGYHSQEIATGNRTNLAIALIENSQVLDEVVVVGYGIQRKVTSTGAVGKVEGDVLSRLNVVNTSKSLQGITSGITVIDRGGAPGSDDPDIFLRGVGTTGTATPLILVDGIEMSLSKIPVQEIESVSVLKDAASASIYGSRAAHGVILVTTKRGSTGKMKLAYNGYIGFQDMAARPKPVSAREY